MKKTYVLEADGVPMLAFRAENDDDAAGFPDSYAQAVVDPSLARPFEGSTITIRLATIPEQAEWRRESVGVDYGDEDEDEYEYEDYSDPDTLVVPLRASPLVIIK
jgi:hypothetical protein